MDSKSSGLFGSEAKAQIPTASKDKLERPMLGSESRHLLRHFYSTSRVGPLDKMIQIFTSTFIIKAE